ncbi:WD40 repeat domain-containing protein [Dactylosporangium sp. CS-033363]|uniref:WD40 repeat domain-containing protein n=1 Tax=Dactylosporangium sp. CS-033363 TaxID=3239935 RepID=UPI003D8CD7FC
MSRFEELDPIRVVEARIVRELLPLAERRPGPPPYIRRHLIEHAAVAGSLDSKVLAPEFLPYVDGVRLRALTGTSSSPGSLVRWWRQVAYAWRWDAPASNADALQFLIAAVGGSLDLMVHPDSVWLPQWVRWSVDTNEIVMRADVAHLVCFDRANGQRLVIIATAEGRILVWDAETITSVADWISDGVEHALLSLNCIDMPDGRALLVTVGLGATVVVYDLFTGVRVRSRISSLRPVEAVLCATLPDGRPIALVVGRSTYFWDMRADRPLSARLPGYFRSVRAMTTVVPGDGRLLLVSVGADNALRVWDLPTGRSLARAWPVHGSVLACVTTSNGRAIAVTATAEGGLQRWDVATAQRLGEPFGRRDRAISRLATAKMADGRVLVIVAEVVSVEVWDVETGERVTGLSIENIHGAGMTACSTLGDRRTVAFMATWDDNVRMCDLDTLGSVTRRRSSGIVSKIAHTTHSDGSSLLVVDNNDHIEVRATGTGELLGELASYPLALSAPTDGGGDVLAVMQGETGPASLWKCFADGAIRADFVESLASDSLEDGDLVDLDEARAAAFAPLRDGGMIAVTVHSSGILCRWDVQTGRGRGQPIVCGFYDLSKIRCTLVPGIGPVAAVMASRDNHIQLIDLTRGVPFAQPWVAHDGPITDITFATVDGRSMLVSCGLDRVVRTWHIPDGTLIGTPWTGHTNAISAISCGRLADGRTIAVTGGLDGTLRVWDARNGIEVGHPLAIPSDITEVIVIPSDGVPAVFVAGTGVARFDLRVSG